MPEYRRRKLTVVRCTTFYTNGLYICSKMMEWHSMCSYYNWPVVQCGFSAYTMNDVSAIHWNLTPTTWVENGWAKRRRTTSADRHRENYYTLLSMTVATNSLAWDVEMRTLSQGQREIERLANTIVPHGINGANRIKLMSQTTLSGMWKCQTR